MNIEILVNMIESDKSAQEIARYIEKQKKIDEKDVFIDKLEDIFIEHFEEDKLTEEDVAIIWLLAFSKNISPDNIKKYFKTMRNMIVFSTLSILGGK